MSTQEIEGQAKTVRQLLGVKNAVDYYQREHKWKTMRVQETSGARVPPFPFNIPHGAIPRPCREISTYTLSRSIALNPGLAIKASIALR
jgi:hypothetical protein